MTEEVLYEESDGIADHRDQPSGKEEHADGRRRARHRRRDRRREPLEGGRRRGAARRRRHVHGGLRPDGRRRVGHSLGRAGHRDAGRRVGPGRGPRVHEQQRQALHGGLGVPEAGAGRDQGLGDRGGDRSGSVLRPVVHGERRAHRLRPEPHLRHTDHDALGLPARAGACQAVPPHRPGDRRRHRPPDRARGPRRPAGGAGRARRGRRHGASGTSPPTSSRSTSC